MEQQDKITSKRVQSELAHNLPSGSDLSKIDQLVADNQELLALTKRAFVKREVEKELIPVKEEWEQFAAEHADELEALDKENSAEPHTATIKKLKGTLPYKVAASIIGILITTGVALAAIWSLTPSPSPKGEGSKYTQISDTVKKVTTPLSTRRGAGGEASIVFDNVTLEKILPQIAAYYNKEVKFLNIDACHLRFRFVWDPQQGIDQVIRDLNQFERFTVTLKDNEMIIE